MAGWNVERIAFEFRITQMNPVEPRQVIAAGKTSSDRFKPEIIRSETESQELDAFLLSDRKYRMDEADEEDGLIRVQSEMRNFGLGEYRPHSRQARTPGHPSGDTQPGSSPRPQPGVAANDRLFERALVPKGGASDNLVPFL